MNTDVVNSLDIYSYFELHIFIVLKRLKIPLEEIFIGIMSSN